MKKGCVGDLTGEKQYIYGSVFGGEKKPYLIDIDLIAASMMDQPDVESQSYALHWLQNVNYGLALKQLNTASSLNVF